jgi:hypothetical protein
MPKYTSRNDSTIVVYPSTIAAEPCPNRSANGSVAIIIPEETAPEINPKISIVFFIYVPLE